MKNQESIAKQRKDELFEQKKNGWLRIDTEQKQTVADYCEEYKVFLNAARTERMAAETALVLAKANGFKEFDRNKTYKAGDRVYRLNRGKALILCVVGEQDINEGVHIAAAHIDCPRLDLKQHPLYESSELALLKTHYYGGIRKYQWPALPLALHGVVVKRGGETVQVHIGDDPADPCFVVTDLLPHLAAEQSKRSLADGIRGEELNILVGSCPFNEDAESEQVKLNILNILFEKYGMTEADLVSAELEAVPALPARDVGFDRSMIGSYGHDDRVCAYPALTALFECGTPQHTCLAVLADKEEIGSDGNTGLVSDYLKNFVWDLAKGLGADGWAVLETSKCLSADVNAAFDSTFSDVFEARNASFLNGGVVVTKYTGARGKSGTSDASAEYTGWVRDLLEDADVVWQTGELGKVDIGGGGTVAKYVAALGVDTIDIGVPVLSMHSPFEVVSKLDVYMTHRAILAFYLA